MMRFNVGLLLLLQTYRMVGGLKWLLRVSSRQILSFASCSVLLQNQQAFKNEQEHVTILKCEIF